MSHSLHVLATVLWKIKFKRSLSKCLCSLFISKKKNISWLIVIGFLNSQYLYQLKKKNLLTWILAYIFRQKQFHHPVCWSLYGCLLLTGRFCNSSILCFSLVMDLSGFEAPRVVHWCWHRLQLLSLVQLS